MIKSCQSMIKIVKETSIHGSNNAEIDVGDDQPLETLLEESMKVAEELTIVVHVHEQPLIKLWAQVVEGFWLQVTKEFEVKVIEE